MNLKALVSMFTFMPELETLTKHTINGQTYTWTVANWYYLMALPSTYWSGITLPTCT